MWEFLQKLKQLQPESKNIVLTGLTGEALGEKALVSNGKLVWASVAGGFLEHRARIGFETAATPMRNESGKMCLEWHISSQGVFLSETRKKNHSGSHPKIKKSPVRKNGALFFSFFMRLMY